MNINEKAIKNIFALIKDLKFGEITIKIQDSRIVLVEKHEKIRFGIVADPKNKGGDFVNDSYPSD